MDIIFYIQCHMLCTIPMPCFWKLFSKDRFYPKLHANGNDMKGASCE